MAMIKLKNANGNVSAKVRGEVKAQVEAMLKARVGTDLQESEKGLAMNIGHDESGNAIFAVISVTITQDLTKKVKESKASKTVEVEVPNIFAE
jgi:hypothetical protein